MILLPSRGRPDHLENFITTYHATGATEPITLLLDDDDADNYGTCLIPSDWAVDIAPRTDITTRRNAFFNENPNLEYYGFMSDDIIPKTMQWDVKLRDACLPDMIAYPDDGIQHENLATLPFIGGDLVRRLGWIAYPKIRHWFNDNTIHLIGLELSKLVYVSDVICKHKHWVDGSMEKDKTHNEVPEPKLDEYIFHTDFKERDLRFIINRVMR